MENKDVFNGLVENACDFTERSVRQFHNSPKNSLINFYTGLELFLKARLIAEHWSLIFNRIENVDKQKFEEGDFVSANYDSLITRLDKVVGEKVPSEANIQFNKLRKHRNKLVHFHHDAFTNGDPQQISLILHDHGQAWWYLYRLLTEDWRKIFNDWQDKINFLNWLMHSDPNFITAKWHLVEPLVREREQSGIGFVKCGQCGHLAAEISIETLLTPEKVVLSNCLVCYHREIQLNCPSDDCSGKIWFCEGEGTCHECGIAIDLNYVVDKLAPSYSKDDGEIYLAWCGICDPAVQTVIPFESFWLCLSCLERFNYEDVDTCEWCGEKNVGIDLTASYITGCIGCDGQDPDKL